MSRRGAPEAERLTNALVTIAGQGPRPHCGDPGTSQLWLSEDAAERADACRLCRGCAVLIECDEAAEASNERFGVWSARDFTRPPGKGGRPPTIRLEEDDEAA